MTARSFSDIHKDMTAASVHTRRPLRDVSTAYVQDGAEKDAKKFYAKSMGVDDDLGLVFGWGIVSKKDGQDYFDLQGDHITEKAMLEASADFMQHSRVAKEMHEGDAAGSVVFAFPLTTDIAKAMGVESGQTGLMIAMKPSDPAVVAKFKSGEYTGFSIGGHRIQDKEAA